MLRRSNNIGFSIVPGIVTVVRAKEVAFLVWSYDFLSLFFILENYS